MSHIVTAIGAEAARTREDWETTLLCTEAAERSEEDSNTPVVIPNATQDNYCFEMLSLVRNRYCKSEQKSTLYR